MGHACKIAFTVVLLLAPGFAAPAQTPTAFEQDCAKIATAAGNDTERLHQLFKIKWDYDLRENPEMATETGFGGFDNRWTDESLAAIARRQRELRAPLQAVASIDRGPLSAGDQLNYDLFKRNLEMEIEGTRFKGEYMAITQLGGVQQGVAETLEDSPRATVQDYENMVARLNAVPALVDQIMVLLQKGLAAGITPPRITLRDVPDQIKSLTINDLDKNPVLKPFTEFPPQFPEVGRARLRQEATQALHEKVVPAFSKLYVFMTNSYLPGARESIGMSELPDGPAWYAYEAHVQTTTTKTPGEIHDIGLSEVKRLRGEMDKVIRQTGFMGSFAEFCHYIRTDPRFFYTNADDLLNAYRVHAKMVDPELSRLIGKLPRTQYGVVAIPSFMEKSQTSAYYQPGSARAGRPGYFNVNTYALDMRPKWQMEALAFHESVPGHHLQISLAQEMEDMPEFRKQGSYTAFVEGWALYCEGLGTDLGFYKDPYSKFGQLAFEIWRAIRLVVDTGLHSQHWTRQQAIDYFHENSAQTDQDIIVEVDRYISWPGQALAYKMGQLKIRELREYATRELGLKFDIREFHDHVLDGGALPLDVLEQRIKDWVAAKKSAK
jgi:uncharacterized protein (DUF885 family)